MKYKFIKDMFCEETGGKYSSKKIWGAIIMFLVSAAFILDGLHFYTSNENLFNSMLLAGTTLIGLKVVKDIFNKKTDGTNGPGL
jgi:hypothetical protein